SSRDFWNCRYGCTRPDQRKHPSADIARSDPGGASEAKNPPALSGWVRNAAPPFVPDTPRYGAHARLLGANGVGVVTDWLRNAAQPFVPSAAARRCIEGPQGLVARSHLGSTGASASDGGDDDVG